MALSVFEAAARHQSFTRAATEMAMTQSAACRQIAALECYLGVKLFRRTRRGVTLTEAGERYSQCIRPQLDAVERETLDLMTRGNAGGTLELAVVPTFATKWLLPRIPDLRKACPGLEVHLTPHTRPFLFDASTLDAAIHAGDAPWPGTESIFLMPEHLMAVCSPALISGKGPVEPRAVALLPLLQQSTRPQMWRQWFESLGLSVDNAMSGMRMELFSMLTEAAVHGLGVALIPPFLIERELDEGLLVPLLPHEFPSGRSYFLIYPERKAENPTLRQFRTWLQRQAAASLEPSIRLAR